MILDSSKIVQLRTVDTTTEYYIFNKPKPTIQNIPRTGKKIK